MRNRSRPTEDAPAIVREIAPPDRERPRAEEEATILRARHLPEAEDAVVEKLKAQTFRGDYTADDALNAWRSWEAEAGRNFADPRMEQAHADYEHMFARAYDEARQRETGQVRSEPDTEPMQQRNIHDGPTEPMGPVQVENRPLLKHLEPEDVRDRSPREPIPTDESARARLRAEQEDRWKLAAHYDRKLLVGHRNDFAFMQWAERHRAQLDVDPRLATSEGARNYLERLDRAAQEGPAEYRQVAYTKALVVSGLVRDRLDAETKEAARTRAVAREQARSLPAPEMDRFAAKLAVCLSRPEFSDRTYCRVEAQRIRDLDSRTSDDRERLVLLSAAYNAPSRDFLAANWTRDVELGNGFARDQEQAARDLVHLRQHDDIMRSEAKQHVASGRDDVELLGAFREMQARLALMEDCFERKQLEEDASERAAYIQYVVEERARLKHDEPTAPMRIHNEEG